MNTLIAADFIDEHGFHAEAGEIRRLVNDDGQGKQADQLLRDIERDLRSRFGDTRLTVYITSKRILDGGEIDVRHNVSILGDSPGARNDHWCRLSRDAATLTELRGVLTDLYGQVAHEVRLQRAMQRALEEEQRRREEQQVADAMAAL